MSAVLGIAIRATEAHLVARAGYTRSLAVLAGAKQAGLVTKTSIIVGMGETHDEVVATLADLPAVGVDIVTIGQSLRPTTNHLPIERYVTPEEFERYREWGLEKGFIEVVSGARVRSSYRAEQVLEKNNVGL